MFLCPMELGWPLRILSRFFTCVHTWWGTWSPGRVEDCSSECGTVSRGTWPSAEGIPSPCP